MNAAKSTLLPQVSFSILLALSLKPRHGYELIRQIHEDSKGMLQLGPGALYGAIKTLREANFIEEIPFADSERRRYYRLTKKGWDRLETDITYYENTVRIALQRNLFKKP